MAEFPSPERDTRNENSKESECGISTGWPMTSATELFHLEPQSFDRDSDRAMLAHSLGATLYVPAIKENLAGAVRRQAMAGAKSMVIDLEDAIPDASVDAALTGTEQTLRDLHEDPPDSLLFVRVRSRGSDQAAG